MTAGESSLGKNGDLAMSACACLEMALKMLSVSLTKTGSISLTPLFSIKGDMRSRENMKMTSKCLMDSLTMAMVSVMYFSLKPFLSTPWAHREYTKLSNGHLSKTTLSCAVYGELSATKTCRMSL